VNQLTSHGNVYNTCLRILRQRGHELRLEQGVDNDDLVEREDNWIAIKDHYQLNAPSPIELLGLAALYGHTSPGSLSNDDRRIEADLDLYSDLMARAIIPREEE